MSRGYTDGGKDVSSLEMLSGTRGEAGTNFGVFLSYMVGQAEEHPHRTRTVRDYEYRTVVYFVRCDI